MSNDRGSIAGSSGGQKSGGDLLALAIDSSREWIELWEPGLLEKSGFDSARPTRQIRACSASEQEGLAVLKAAIFSFPEEYLDLHCRERSVSIEDSECLPTGICLARLSRCLVVILPDFDCENSEIEMMSALLEVFYEKGRIANEDWLLDFSRVQKPPGLLLVGLLVSLASLLAEKSRLLHIAWLRASLFEEPVRGSLCRILGLRQVGEYLAQA